MVEGVDMGLGSGCSPDDVIDAIIEVCADVEVVVVVIVVDVVVVVVVDDEIEVVSGSLMGFDGGSGGVSPSPNCWHCTVMSVLSVAFKVHL